MTKQALRSQMTIAFVGALVPDVEEFHNPAFSRAGHLFQHNFLRGLKSAGAPISVALCARPIPSYPQGPCRWFNSRVVGFAWGCDVRLIPFLNLTPFKQVCFGLGVALELVRWRWHVGWARPAVVLIYNLSVPPAAVVLLACRLIHAKCVASINDMDVPGETVPNSLLFRLDFRVQKWCIRRLDGMNVVAEAIATEFGKGVPWLRIEGGLDQAVIDHDRSCYKDTRGRNTFTIAAVGSLDIANGILVILQAFALLSDRTYRLLIAGAGPLESEVRAAMAQDDRIEYRGYVSLSDVLSLYGMADLVLNVRLTESLNTKYFFPSKLIEAMASGAPVISTRTGHVEREFSDKLFLLKDETPQGLASLVRDVRELPPDTREGLGKTARQYMLSEMTWERQGQRFTEFLRTKVLTRDRSFTSQSASNLATDISE